VEAPDEATFRGRGARSEFEALLNELIERPYDRRDIERRIEERFTTITAVMVLDMSGFTRTTQIRGIVPYLLMIHQMRLLATPIVERFGGRVVKAEADNLFCLFDTVEDAVTAGREITRTLDTANVLLPDELALYASIGIGFGPILTFGDDEIAGNEVNLASKLGEDVADRKEILLTPGARAEVRSQNELDQRRIAISGLEFDYYILQGE
jgi:class 3 adenylate cyclase